MDNKEFKPVNLYVSHPYYSPRIKYPFKGKLLSYFPRLPSRHTEYQYSHHSTFYIFELYYSISHAYYFKILYWSNGYTFNALKNRDLVNLFLSALSIYGYNFFLLRCLSRAGLDYFLVYDKNLFTWL